MARRLSWRRYYDRQPNGAWVYCDECDGEVAVIFLKGSKADWVAHPDSWVSYQKGSGEMLSVSEWVRIADEQFATFERMLDLLNEAEGRKAAVDDGRFRQEWQGDFEES